MQRPGAQLRDGRPWRQRQHIGADQPDQIGQRQHDDHEQRKQRIERDQHAPAARRRERKCRDQKQQADCRGGGQQQQAGLDRPCEPGVATALADQLPGMQQQQRPKRPRQHQRAELDAGRTEGRTVSVSKHREHRLLSADNGARQQIQRRERDDRAKLRQQIDAEHVIAGERGTRCRRARTPAAGRDRCRPVFPAIGQHGRKVAGRASVQHKRQDQPQRGLAQHHDPHDQPRPGADQFDNQRGETHEPPEMPRISSRSRRCLLPPLDPDF